MATYYWVGGNGTWNNANTANWSNATGGASGFGPPLAADTVIFDSASGTGTCTTATGSVCATATLNSATLGLTLGANHTMSGTFTLTTGTLTLATYTLTANIFSSSGTTARSVAFGTGSINLGGNSTGIWSCNDVTNFTYTGTSNINLTYSGSTGTRNVLHGALAGGSEANAVNINVTAGSDIVAFYLSISASFIKSANFTGFSGTFANTYATSIYGDLTLSTGMTIASGTNGLTFRGTLAPQKITTNGKTMDIPVAMSGNTQPLQLQDNLTLGSTRTFTLGTNTLDLNNRTLSTGIFSSNNSNTRSIAFGTGNITVTNSGTTVIAMNILTGFTFTGTSNIISNYSGSTGTRTIRVGNSGGGSETNAVSVYVTAGSDAVSSAGFFRNLDFTGYSGAMTLGDNHTIYGNLTISSGMSVVATANSFGFYATSGTQLVTTNNVTIDAPFFRSGVGGTVQLQDNLTVGSTRTFNLLSGTLNLNGKNLTTGIFLSTNTSVRTITSGIGQFYVTGNAATVFSIANDTNLTLTDAPTVNASYAGATGTRTITGGSGVSSTPLNVNITAGSDTVTIGTTAAYGSLNFTGFSGTLNNTAPVVFGSYTLSSGMTLTAGTSATTFSSTSAGKTITSAGKTIDFPLIFNGIGGVWTCQDALTLGSTRALTMTNGTLNLKSGATSTVGSFVTSGTNQKYLGASTPGSQATISDASGVNSVSYMTISDSFATGGATWDAFYGNNNVNFGNNTNWDFGESPVLGNEYEYKLRSMTEPRRF